MRRWVVAGVAGWICCATCGAVNFRFSDRHHTSGNHGDDWPRAPVRGRARTQPTQPLRSQMWPRQARVDYDWTLESLPRKGFPAFFSNVPSYPYSRTRTSASLSRYFWYTTSAGYTGIPDPELEYDWRIFALQWADDHRLGSRAWAVLLFLAGRPSADPMPC